jgi:hypothetical protein
MGLIDRMPDITAQPGPTQKFGVGGVSMFTGAGTGIRGSGHNKDASTGKAMTWIVDSVAADALVKLSTGAYLERVAMTNRGAGGFAVLVQNEHCSMRDVLIQGCVGDGVHIITNNSDGNMFEQTTIRENGGVGWSITGSNTVEPPNGLLFIGCKGHGNQFQQWLYDSTDTTAGTNKAGENLLFLGCQAQGPGAYAGIGAPMVEIRGGKGMGWYDTYFETGGAQNFSALRIDAGGVAYNGRASQQVSFIRPRFHTNHTGTIPAVYIDHAQGCELLDPVFDVGYTPSSSQPLVYLGANTKGCRVRIGPQPQLTSVARNATVTDLGQGNDVLIWDYGLNQYVQVGQGPSYMTASGGDSGNSATAAPTISTTAISLANANFIPYTVGTNTTFTMPSGLPTGRVLIFRLKLTQTGGGFTAAFTGVKWNAATAPTLSATNGYVDIFRFMTHDGGTTWYGFVEGQHMA